MSAYLVDVTECNGGVNGVLRAVGEEVGRNIGVVCVIPAHCPAEHVQLVHCAAADCVRTMLHEQTYDGHVAVLRREVQRHRVIAIVTDVRIGAALEQQSHHCFVRDCVMQCSARTIVAGYYSAFVDDVGVCVEQCG